MAGMLRQKFLASLALMPVLVIGAVAFDWLINVFFLKNPSGFTPYATVAITLTIGWPTGFVLISQRLDVGAVKERLALAVEENRRAAVEAQTARVAAEEGGRVKAEFLANVTHELRTPLNAIIGFSSLLRGETNLTPEAQRKLAIILEAGQTLLAIVDDVLDFSRLDSGKLEFDAYPFDPVEEAQVCLDLVEEQARAKGLSLELQVDGAGAWRLGDGLRVRQVILNFVSNAIKFTASGSVLVRVTQTEADAGSPLLRIEVKDTGIGIPPELHDRIFSRFSQADESISRRYGGSGLGLSICKAIVENMGGVLGVESALGAGATFWCELPLPVSKELSEADSVSHDFADDLAILIVDDNALNRELVRAMLSPFTRRLDEASDGVDAVERAAHYAYDLILMDVQMPNMDGLTATRMIRSKSVAAGGRTPIVAMTANVLPHQVAQCMAAGMNSHIGKPIKPFELLETLHLVVARSSAA